MTISRQESLPKVTEAELERFVKRVQPQANGCWLWVGAKADQTYGRIIIGKKYWLVHRLAFTLFKRIPLAKGEVVCHSCDTPLCVNPEHLFKGTQAINLADMRRKGRAKPRRSKRDIGLALSAVAGSR